MSAYFHEGLRRYLEETVDWDDRLEHHEGKGLGRKGAHRSFVDLLETTALICGAMEAELRAARSEPVRLREGELVCPPHIETTYRTLASAGLVSLGVKEEYGGLELPTVVSNMIFQMTARADARLMTLIGSQSEVANEIQRRGSNELKKRYLPGFASGDWMGAMELSQPSPDAGTGGRMICAAEGRGGIRLDGKKTFSASGKNDIYLVQALEADRFEPSVGKERGPSLFLCPRLLPDGRRNGVRVVGLEDRNGSQGVPTAEVKFDGAIAFRMETEGVGRGAKLAVTKNTSLPGAALSIGAAEALLHAIETPARKRGSRRIKLVREPDIQDLLLNMRLGLDGSQALLYRTANLIDRNDSIRAYLRRVVVPTDERERYVLSHRRNEIRIRLLTPLAQYMSAESRDEIICYAARVNGKLDLTGDFELATLKSDPGITDLSEGRSEAYASFAVGEIMNGALAAEFEAIACQLDKLGSGPAGAGGHTETVRCAIAQIFEVAPVLLSDERGALRSARSLVEAVISVVVAAELLGQARSETDRLTIAMSWIERRLARTSRLSLPVHAIKIERPIAFEPHAASANG